MGFFDGFGLGDLIASVNPFNWLGANIDRNFQSNMQHESMQNQRYLQQMQQEWASQENSLARDWQGQQAELARQWQTGENQAARNWQRQEWDRQFEMNSPKKQVERLLAAGINPSVMMGEGSGFAGMGGVSASAGGSAPSAGGASMVGAGNVSPLNVPSSSHFTQAALNSSHVLRNLADAKEKGANTEHVMALLETDIASAELKRSLMELDYEVQYSIKDTKIKKEYQTLQEILSRISLNKELEQTEREKQITEAAHSFMYQMLGKLQGAEANRINSSLNAYINNLISDTRKNYSIVEHNKSMTRLNNAIRETENQLREGRVNIQELDYFGKLYSNEILANEMFVSNKTAGAKVDMVFQNLRKEGLLSEQAYQQLQILKVKSDWAGRQEYANYVGAIIHSVSEGFSAISNGRSVEFRNLNDSQRNKIRERTNEIYEESVRSRANRGSASSRSDGSIFDHVPPQDLDYYNQYFPMP